MANSIDILSRRLSQLPETGETWQERYEILRQISQGKADREYLGQRLSRIPETSGTWQERYELMKSIYQE